MYVKKLQYTVDMPKMCLRSFRNSISITLFVHQRAVPTKCPIHTIDYWSMNRYLIMKLSPTSLFLKMTSTHSFIETPESMNTQTLRISLTTAHNTLKSILSECALVASCFDITLV